MLIDQFIDFLKEASDWPQYFWGHKLYAARKSFIFQLDDIKQSLDKKNVRSAEEIESLISLLNQDIDELRLAESFYNLSLIFTESGRHDEKIKQFSELARKFLARAQLFDSFRKTRENLKLTEEQKKEYDHRFFANEGIFYCLEYYLAVYKKLSDLSDINEKKEFFLAREINLGFGNLPGLKEDFKKDEILEKFILPIQNDSSRGQLLISYYACRNLAVNNDTDIIDLEKAFKKFIYYLLLSFDENKIEKLSSKFFKPYGNQPTIKELIPIFKSYEG